MLQREDYMPMAYFVCSKLKLSHLKQDDIESLAGLVYTKCMQQHDGREGTWPSYLYRSMRTEFLREDAYERERRGMGRSNSGKGKKADKVSTVSLNALQEVGDWGEPQVEPNQEIMLLFNEMRDILRKKLEKTEFFAIMAYELDGLTFKEIAECLNCSKTSAENYYKRGMAKASNIARRIELENLLCNYKRS